MLPLNILEAPRSVKRLIMVAADLVILPASFFIALQLRTDFSHYNLKPYAFYALGITIFFSILFFIRIGLYRAVVRFIGQDAIKAVIKGVSFSAIVLGLTVIFLDTGIPRSIPFIYWAVALLLVTGSRWGVREFINSQRQTKKIRVAIYGAGSSGQALLRALKNTHHCDPVLLIDDNKKLRGSVFQGVRVVSPRRIAASVKEKGVEQILLAMPSISTQRRKAILENLVPLAVRVQTIPSFEQLISGSAGIEELHDVNVEDLLGRDPVVPDETLLSSCIQNKVVMVTGAGGSIGSELCRQIILLEPGKLVLFELSEYGLYAIDKELRGIIESKQLTVELVPLLGSVQNKSRVLAVMQTFAVNTVYHAAAYKHVPMVEHNMLEGVNNNVFGTYYAALAALEANVETFVLISTDKAVRPTNVMGVSKRLAELVLQGLAKSLAGGNKKLNKQFSVQSNTRFCMVRFGNVLASSGSVVPLFQKQIKEGGPVTVTHPDIIRYFMTIPEAAQLVIQAGAMATGGDVFVLDMGEPVKIAELARTLIHLSGLREVDAETSVGDIEIKYTGLRPGEKLYEELLIDDNSQPTQHPRIMRAEEPFMSWEELETVLTDLKKANLAGDCDQVMAILLTLGAEYQPAENSNDLLWQQKAQFSVKPSVVSLERGLKEA